MKRYKIQLNGFKKPIEFNLPVISLKLRKTNLILNIVNYLYLTFIPLFLFCLPLITLLKNGVALELNLLNYLIISTSFLLILFLTRLVLLGLKVLMDPPFFINLLFFALLTTTSSVIVSSPDALNTFGSGNFRALSGLVIMSLLTIFYIFSSYFKDYFRLRKFIKFITLGFISYLVVIILDPTLVSLTTTISFITLFVIFYLFYSLNSDKNKLIKLSVVSVLVGLALLRLSTFKTFFNEIYVVLFVLLFVSVISLILTFILKRDLVILSLLKFKNFLELFRAKKYRTLFRNTLIQLLILSPLIILILLLILTSQNYGTFLIFNIVVERLVLTLQGFFELAQGNFLTILSGFGFIGYRSSLPLISNILYMQGLLGLLAYISLGAYLVFKSISLLRKSIKDYRLVLGILVSVLFMVFYSLLSYTGLLPIIFIWLLIMILSFLNRSKSSDELLENVKPLTIRGRLNNRYGVLLRLVILIVLITLIVLGAISFVNAVKLY